MTEPQRTIPTSKRVRKTVVHRALITPKAIQDCLEAGFSQAEIAAHLGVDRKTLERRIKREPELRLLVDNGPHLRKRALKLLQWAKARQGNVAMLIHLGKAELGQNGDAPQPGGGGVRLVVTRPVLTPQQWDEQYGPMRGTPPQEGE
jgi:hypothetical protein